MENSELKEFQKRIDLLKIHFECIGDDLAMKGSVSKATFYRLLNGKGSDKMLLTFAENLGVNYEWLKNGKGEMNDKGTKPFITTKSDDIGIKALIEQINFLQSQLIVKDAQLVEKDVIIKSLVKPSPRTRHHSVLVNRGVLVAARG